MSTVLRKSLEGDMVLKYQSRSLPLMMPFFSVRLVNVTIESAFLNLFNLPLNNRWRAFSKHTLLVAANFHHKTKISMYALTYFFIEVGVFFCHLTRIPTVIMGMCLLVTVTFLSNMKFGPQQGIHFIGHLSD